ncbi:MAG TPA: hypothetical protein VEK80_17730 [Kribbellaceae bacterium]|nr:hypothetical protein [Kribbellaceae bacterium]
MPESAEEVYARVVAAVGEEGRLPMPPVYEWDMFPWELVDGELQPKVVQKPYPGSEPPRWGEAHDKPCGTCDGGEKNTIIWENDRWFVNRSEAPTGLPLVLWLKPKEHLDLTDLDDDMAAEMGRISTWLCRIMSNLPNIGRVHVNRWGDGGSHLHWWFIARTARLPHIIGSMAVEWDQMLPPGPEDVWLADVHTVAAKLATHDGRALV